MIGKIDPDINNLNILFEKFKWLPNEEKIRPTDNILIKKRIFIKSILDINMTFEEYIINIFFDKNKFNQKYFVKNSFPYNIEGNHYIMWYYKYDEIYDDLINKDIYDNIFKIVKNNNFNFAWYENPKMSIPSKVLYHVQVFWIDLN